jgi:hypothetical protein
MRSMDDSVKYPTVEFQLAEVATLLKFHSLRIFTICANTFHFEAIHKYKRSRTKHDA